MENYQFKLFLDNFLGGVGGYAKNYNGLPEV